ncbi:GNAT family N-acetyltransferase [Streptomyces acidiscabies]|uniref:GNAT family N-acetyltransferase n=1 Tax=Streptomyces acidiscabies TaxID=42234 RepID=UPI0030CEA598
MDFSVKPVLSGPLTVLRPFTEADAEVMAHLMEDPEVALFTGASPNPVTPESLRAWYGSRGAQGDRLGLHRIELEAYAFNSRAIRVYEKVGFLHEGVRKEIELKDGKWVDEVVMAVLEDEWAVHRGHPEIAEVTEVTGVTPTVR